MAPGVGRILLGTRPSPPRPSGGLPRRRTPGGPAGATGSPPDSGSRRACPPIDKKAGARETISGPPR